MRKLLLGCLLLMGIGASAQNLPARDIVYKDWQMLGESNDHIDVSARIAKCGNNAAQVHLFIFNESTSNQTTKFSIEITNLADGKKFTKEVTYATERAKIYKALCDSDAAMNALKITLPSGYDPSNLEIDIAFKN